jgi:hypothetical protein
MRGTEAVNIKNKSRTITMPIAIAPGVIDLSLCTTPSVFQAMALVSDSRDDLPKKQALTTSGKR